MANTNMNQISELSAIIARNTAKIDEYFTEKRLPTPSLEEDALWKLPIPEDAKDIVAARLAVIDACSNLKALMTGPKELLSFKVSYPMSYCYTLYLIVSQYTAYVSVKVILRFKLDRSFPVGKQTSFEDMSEFSGLSVLNVRRIVRHAIYNHRLFQEKSPGVISHSALTAVLAGDDLARNALIVELDEFWPAAVKVLLKKFCKSLDTNGTRLLTLWRGGLTQKKTTRR